MPTFQELIVGNHSNKINKINKRLLEIADTGKDEDQWNNIAILPLSDLNQNNIINFFMQTDKKGRTFLHLAVRTKCKKVETFKTIVSFFKECIIDQDAFLRILYMEDNYSNTILHYLAERSYQQDRMIVEYLQEMNFLTEDFLDKINFYDETAFYLAYCRSYHRLFPLLIILPPNEALTPVNIGHVKPTYNIGRYGNLSQGQEKFKNLYRDAHQEGCRDLFGSSNIISMCLQILSAVSGVLSELDDADDTWKISWKVVSMVVFVMGLLASIDGILSTEKEYKDAKEPFGTYDSNCKKKLGQVIVPLSAASIVGLITQGLGLFSPFSTTVKSTLSAAAPLVTAGGLGAYDAFLKAKTQHYQKISDEFEAADEPIGPRPLEP